MPTDYVFTLTSLQACLVSGEASWFAKMSGDVCPRWHVERVEIGDSLYFIHESDEPASRRIVVFDHSDGGSNRAWMKRTVLERIHRAAIAAATPPVSLPRDWHAYHYNNLFAFYGNPRGQQEGKKLRWTAETRPLNSFDVLFWQLTPTKELEALEFFRPDYGRYQDAVAFWEEALAEARQRFRLSAPAPDWSVSPIVALEQTFGAVSQGRSYLDWLPKLNPDQSRFLESAQPPVKLRGPAGTGKTLCLLLKAIHDVKAAQDLNEKCHALFLTHSWAMATQIDKLLQDMGEAEATADIDVYPLFSLNSLLMDNRLPYGLEPLGEDSDSGKKEQMKRILALLERSVTTMLPAVRSQCRNEFVSAVESDPDSDEFRLFAWDILNEFACVLGPEGIVPGTPTAAMEYQELTRSPWMMSLETSAEKDFLLQLYGEYVQELRDAKLISADQVINDFVKDLEKATWQYRRITDGYDLVFVDELHLFNEQERRILHHLSRDARNYPKMFMALDPRQSPEVVYAGIAGGSITRDEPGDGGRELSEVKQVSLTRVHRFGPEVLALLRHINKSWPALDFGDDWQLDLDNARTQGLSTDVPVLYTHRQLTEEAGAALQSAATSRSDAGRVAVVLVSAEALETYEEVADQGDYGRLNILRSRDDLAQLQYTQRTVVLAPAEYVAGLQFETVVVGGLPILGRRASWQRSRYLLSQLYLAISRASSHVEIHVNQRSGGIPEVLTTALEAGALIKKT